MLCYKQKRFCEIVFLYSYPQRDTDLVLQCQRVLNITEYIITEATYFIRKVDRFNLSAPLYK